ncbi:hypothetical protein IR009_00735 [Pseudomonas putida]|uniref:hypothetical protein n=1 Tax=Pseudomonas putida TaxID=303 RepID=UPI0018A9BAA1|nr:hypothetical protein [Pseudomonas putida]
MFRIKVHIAGYCLFDHTIVDHAFDLAGKIAGFFWRTPDADDTEFTAPAICTVPWTIELSPTMPSPSMTFQPLDWAYRKADSISLLGWVGRGIDFLDSGTETSVVN